MLFLGIISWKGATCFNREAVRFSDEGASFLSGAGPPHEGGISFDEGVRKKS